MDAPDRPWVSYAGVTLSGIAEFRRKRTVEACPKCGQAVEMVYAGDIGGTIWLRAECPDCGRRGCFAGVRRQCPIL